MTDRRVEPSRRSAAGASTGRALGASWPGRGASIPATESPPKTATPEEPLKTATPEEPPNTATPEPPQAPTSESPPNTATPEEPPKTATPEPPYTRLEHFPVVGSTNDVVRHWLAAGTPEICVAVAEEQTAGRGRAGRTWLAPPRAALLVSLGFRPNWLPADRAWRIPAIVALAMADAAEEIAGLPERAIWLKWPNDLVVVTAGPDALLIGDIDALEARRRLTAPLEYRKLAGVLGETDGLGTSDPRLVVGIGVNADWPASTFPAELRGTMTSLREASGGRPIDRLALLDAFLDHLAARVEALRSGRFPMDDWMARQLTTGRLVRLELARPEARQSVSGSIEREAGTITALAVGLDPQTGALLVADPEQPEAPERAVHVGEVRQVRLARGPAELGGSGRVEETQGDGSPENAAPGRPTGGGQGSLTGGM